MNQKTLFFSTLLFFFLTKADELTKFISPNNTTLATYISSANFKKKGDTSLVRTYTIDTPGTYILTENIASSVVSTSTAVIYINSDNVILNLGGHTVSQTSSESSIDGIAIEIEKNNITIENGVIKNCTGNGISINYGCSNIICDTLWIIGCIESGINLAGTESEPLTTISINNSNISLNNGNASHDAIGIKMSYCIGCTIESSDCNNNSNTNSGRSAYGIYCQNCQSCIFKKVVTKKHVGTLLGCGFYFDVSDSLFLTSCYSINNETTTDNTANPSVGFYLNEVARSIFEYNTTLKNTNGKNAYGFYLNTAVCNYFYKCNALSSHVHNGTSISDKAVGFRFDLDSNSNVLDECRGNSNAVMGSSGQGWGFEAYDSHANFIYKCVLSSNRGDGGGAGVWRNGAKRNNSLLNVGGSNTGGTTGYRIVVDDSSSVSESTSGSANAQLTNTHYPY